jgi:hypothetical protein
MFNFSLKAILSAIVLATLFLGGSLPSALAKAPLPADLIGMDQIGPHPAAVDIIDDYQQIIYVWSEAQPTTATAGARELPFMILAEALVSITDADKDNRYAVLVAGGTYYEANLRLKPYVDLYGSFDPANFKSRDLYNHPTVLNGLRAGPVVRGSDDARIDGFKITGGMHDGMGGAIVCKKTSPIITNNIIVGNKTVHMKPLVRDTLHVHAHDGGAIAILRGSNAQVLNNILIDNATNVGDGGAISVRTASNPTISKNIIMHNQAGLTDSTRHEHHLGSRSSNGGGISVSSDSVPVISSNIIALNQVYYTNDAGGIYFEYECPALIKGNWLLGNTSSDDGGAIYIRGLKDGNHPPKGPTVEGNIFAGNWVLNPHRGLDQLTDAIFFSKRGRGHIKDNLFAHQLNGIGNANSVMVVEGNTIVDHTQSGIYMDLRDQYDFVEQSTITGNIIWGNQKKGLELNRTVHAPPVPTDNIIQGGYEGKGNVATDPKFIDDSLRGPILSREYDATHFVTRLQVKADLAGQDLPGRAVQIGREWSVIRSSSADSLIVWGNITDGASQFMIMGTYRR